MARTRTSEPLRGAFIAIVAAAIGALGTLGGNALSNANAQNLLEHDDKVRQDDLRLDAYAEFISLAAAYVIRLQTGRADASDVQEILASSGKIELVGSRETADQANQIANALIEITNENVLGEEIDWKEAGRRAGETYPLINDFVSLARREVN